MGFCGSNMSYSCIFSGFFSHLGHHNGHFFNLNFLRPFLKTRSHDGSAHSFGSCHQFLEVPQKGVLKNNCFGFFFFTKVGGLIRYTKIQ